MSGRAEQVDVVVLGAGTAGSHAAGLLAAAGRSVVLVDRRSADAAGAQWHNGVLPWQFAEAGAAAPVADELDGNRGTSHLYSAKGHLGCSITDPPVVRADMGSLGRSLRTIALHAGVELLDRTRAVRPAIDAAGRLRSLEVDRSDGSTVTLQADLFVDASGRSGTLRRHSPALAPWVTEVRGNEQCTATDQHVQIDDPDGARRFLDRYRAQPGDTVTVLGVAGGWSTRVVTVNKDASEASVLVGCIADGRHSTGPRLFAETLDLHPWLGKVRSGGTGVIPLRRPFARFTAPGLALVGDAACQVFPAHGSGIGFGLIASKFLADAVADAADPGDQTVLWRYQHRFQSRYGGTLAAFDALRRMSTALGERGVGRMIGAGLLGEDVSRAGLEQRWEVPSTKDLPAQALRLAKVPGVAAVMLPRLANSARLATMGASYPATVDLVALGRWETRMQRLVGAVPTS